jgi:hypothetical protein
LEKEGGSALGIRLISRVRGEEGGRLHAGRIDACDPWITPDIEPVAFGVDDLRDESDVGKPGALAVAEATAFRLARQKLFKSPKPRVDPVVVPDRENLLVVAQPPVQATQNPQIVERVDIAGDDLGERANPRPIRRPVGQEGRFGMGFVEIFDDRQRLNEDLPAVLDGGDEALGVEGEIGGLFLIAAAPMDKRALIGKAFEIEGDADAERGRRAKEGVKLHGGGRSPRKPMSIHLKPNVAS